LQDSTSAFIALFQQYIVAVFQVNYSTTVTVKARPHYAVTPDSAVHLEGGSEKLSHQISQIDQN